VEKENRRTVMCFDRTSGKVLWQQGPTYTEKELTHATNPQCSASPVTDGDRVIASFGSAGLYCYSMDGKKLWNRDLGKQTHIWGNAASPMIYGDLCVLNFGPGDRTFLLALNKANGETVWQHDEPGGDSGIEKPGKKPGWIGSWSTPLFISVGGRDELVLSYPNRVVAFSPKDGQEIWTCSGLNPLSYTSPLFAQGIVVAMGGYNGMALAVLANGEGDVTSTKRLWHHPKSRQRIGSGVIAGNYVFVLDDPGIAECLELKTGKLVWENRLSGPASAKDSWSSMVLSGDKIYVINKGGDAFVLKASPEFQLLATNSIGETTLASLAPADGQFFIRTYQHLWCIGESGH
jgi:outer membrane protein assembly factor BamB